MSNESVGLRLTAQHICRVQWYVAQAISNLSSRSVAHDQSKYTDDEFDLVEGKEKLDKLEYGSTEYEEALAAVMDAVRVHYKINPHHPGHYENGILGMSLLDLIEMLCDWMAAGELTNGSMRNSIDVGESRYEIPKPIVQILENTAIELGMME